MATTGVNNTVKWELADGVLTLSPVDGVSGIAKLDGFIDNSHIASYIDLTNNEWQNVKQIIFQGNISFQYKPIMKDYTTLNSLNKFFANPSEILYSPLPLLESVDVSGLDTQDITDMSYMFSIPTLNHIKGLETFNTSKCLNYEGMFEHTRLTSLDLSSFEINSEANILIMLGDMLYCKEITLPNSFSRKNSSAQGSYSFGLCPLRGSATKDGITILSDEDFFHLTTPQGGTWIRELNQSIPLYFKAKNTDRDSQTINITYDYRTNADTQVSVFYKVAEDVNYPTNPQKTFNITGVGNNAMLSLTVDSDRAYDVMMIASDGTTNVYSFVRAERNILLFTLNESTHALSAYSDNQKVLGVTWDGDAELYLDTNAASGTDYEIRQSLTKLGWTDCIV